ncbi:hypothetical protein [Sphingomonas azotifigens]|uniref:hypothetical protein n=1 Tax=Sphingomonas azotifigens TaxID=330920 RepID=UPI001FE34A28|nr:hypothetical protein [Sphingomonas azotifigens]
MPSTIAPEVIACIAEGRPPTPGELARVAERVRADLVGDRPAFAWGDGQPETAEQLSRRVAELALIGSRR